MNRSFYTAKFKRDYVAYSAVGIFCFIVCAEIALAVSIPAYFVKSDLWAIQMQRQKLVSRFDALRGQVDNAKLKDDSADAEIKIVGWSLNMMANYLRLNREKLQGGRIGSLNQDFDSFQAIISKLKKEGAYNREIPVATGDFLTRLTEKLPPVPGGNQEKI